MVVLTADSSQYDFADYCPHESGQTFSVSAPLDRIPMFVRSVAILPWGIVAQSTVQQASLPLEIIVFPGADGSFTLYQDEGDGYGYEQGQCTLVRLIWQDDERRLTIGDREGNNLHMPADMTFLVHCAGEKVYEMVYHGEAMSIIL